MREYSLAPAQTVDVILMQKLVKGIHKFQDGIFSAKRRLSEGLLDGKPPLAFFIICSDFYWNPSLLTRTERRELFTLQNAGNIVAPCGAATGDADATIKYVVNVLGARDIVICGHSHCGVMGCLLDQSQVMELPAVRSWLSHAKSTYRIIEENYTHITDATARLTATAQENVLVQLEHLQTYPAVAAALAKKALNLHGWLYEFDTGQLFAYDSKDGQFVQID